MVEALQKSWGTALAYRLPRFPGFGMLGALCLEPGDAAAKVQDTCR